MPAMTIRKLSDGAVQAMKSRARANGRSAEAEARLALETAFAPKPAFKSAWQVIEDFKTANGGGLELPQQERSMEAMKPAEFE